MQDDRQCVVLIHGLWCRPLVMRYLQFRLERAGFRCFLPAYRSLRDSPEEAARMLLNQIRSSEVTVNHIVGHSLGGVVALHLLDGLNEGLNGDLNQGPPGHSGHSGRIVLLGSPVQGAELARRAASRPWLRMFLGQSYPALGNAAPIPAIGRSDIGVIAGDSGPGLVGWLARVLMRHRACGDGLVAVNETTVPEASLRIVPYSHGRLLFSSAVARLIVCFLQKGVFCDEKKSQQG